MIKGFELEENSPQKISMFVEVSEWTKLFALSPVICTVCLHL